MTEIRIGDPDETVRGQHRYVLSYTLPEARLSSGELALDIIGTDETLETERFEIVVTGFELDDPLCNVGDADDSGGCELERDGDVYRAVISPLDPGDGITIGGTIVGRHRCRRAADPRHPRAPPAPHRTAGAGDDPARPRQRRLGVRDRPAAWPQRGVRRRGRRRRLRRRCRTRAVTDRWTDRPACASCPTTRWTSWRRSSSSPRRGSHRGRARCC